MTSTDELLQLIAKAKAKGCTVTCTYDQMALLTEGRKIIESVQVQGMKGCGPHPMSAVGATERLREMTA